MSYTLKKRDNVLNYIAGHPGLQRSLASVVELDINEFEATELVNDFFVLGYTNQPLNPTITDFGKKYLESQL